MEINGKLTLLKADDLILISPGVPHYFMAGTKRGCGIIQLKYTISLPDNPSDNFRFVYGEKESKQRYGLNLHSPSCIWNWPVRRSVKERRKMKTVSMCKNSF